MQVLGKVIDILYNNAAIMSEWNDDLFFRGRLFQPCWMVMPKTKSAIAPRIIATDVLK